MAASDKFPGDTCFFIFEQDFEFTRPADPAPARAFSRELDWGAWGAWRHERTETASAPAAPSHGQKRKRPDLPDEIRQDASHAADLVKIMNVASRLNVADVFWLGYQPCQKSGNKDTWTSPRVNFGTTLISINQDGAFHLLEAMKNKRMPPGHIDMELLKFCKDPTLSGIKTGYVFPPIGSYGGHVSECCPDVGFRTSAWDDTWTAEGTRPSQDKKNSRSKDIYSFWPYGVGRVCKLESLDEAYFNRVDGIWRSYICLEDEDEAATSSDMVQRHRRREKTKLRFRYNQPTPYNEAFNRERHYLVNLSHVRWV